MAELSYRTRTILFYASRIILVLLALGLLIAAIMFVSDLASPDESTPAETTTETTTETESDTSAPSDDQEPGPIQQEYDALTEGQEEEANSNQDSQQEAQKPQQQNNTKANQNNNDNKSGATKAPESDIPNTGPMDVVSFIAIPVIVYFAVRYYDTKRLLNTPTDR